MNTPITYTHPICMLYLIGESGTSYLGVFLRKDTKKEGQIIEIDGIKGEIIAMDNTTITLKTGDSKTIFPLQVMQSKTVIVFE